MNDRAGGSLAANEAADLRAFALRLTGNSLHRLNSAPQILVGKLPERMPADIPMPDDSQIAGSVVHDGLIRINFDTSLSPEQAIDFYRERLLAAGWEDIEQHRSSFLGRGMQLGRFLFGEDEPSLIVQPHTGADASTSVWLYLHTEPRPLLAQRRMPPESILPQLIPPDAGHQYSDGSSWSSGQRSASATLDMEVTSEQTLATLAEHYDTQLEQARWSRVRPGEAGPVAWSTWTFLDDKGAEWESVSSSCNNPGHNRNIF